MEKQESYLDKLAYKATILLLWSGVILWTVLIGSAVYSLFEGDKKIIGYTYHGLPIYESDIEEKDGDEK